MYLWPVELGREESRSCFQDFVGPAQLGVLAAKPLELGRLLAADSRSGPGVDLGMPYPFAQRLRGPTPSLCATAVIAAYSDS